MFFVIFSFEIAFHSVFMCKVADLVLQCLFLLKFLRVVNECTVHSVAQPQPIVCSCCHFEGSCVLAFVYMADELPHLEPEYPDEPNEIPAGQPEPPVEQEEETAVAATAMDAGDDPSTDEDPPVLRKPAAKATATKSPPLRRPAAAIQESVPKGKGKAKAKASEPVPKGKGKVQGKGKGKGKANAVAKNGAKPGAKPGAKAPPTPKTPMKRPAASKVEKLQENFDFAHDDEDDPMDAMQEGEEEEEPEDHDGDQAEDEEDDDEKRDRVKSRKFMSMVKQGSLPGAVLDAWKHCTSRKDSTKLINTLFSKTPDGKLTLQENYTTPTAYKMERSLEKKDVAQDNANGFGRLIFKKKFGLSDDELDAAVARGEVIAWDHAGLQLFAATNVRFTCEASKSTKENISGKEVQFDERSGREFQKMFDGMQVNVSSPARPGPASVADKDAGKPWPI